MKATLLLLPFLLICTACGNANSSPDARVAGRDAALRDLDVGPMPDAATIGTEGEPCFADGACFLGMTCLSGTCVRRTPNDGGTIASSDAGAPGSDAGSSGDAGEGTLNYPSGPYGTSVGKVVDNALVVIYGHPMGSVADPANVRQIIALASFYDPLGNRGPGGTPNKTLLVNVVARWDSGSMAEAASLEALCETYAPMGLVCYTAIAEDAFQGRATESDSAWWAQNYGLEFATCADPEFLWGAMFHSPSWPLNMFIDLATMRILFTANGPPEDLEREMDLYTRCPSAVCSAGQYCADDGTCQSADGGL